MFLRRFNDVGNFIVSRWFWQENVKTTSFRLVTVAIVRIDRHRDQQLVTQICIVQIFGHFKSIAPWHLNIQENDMRRKFVDSTDNLLAV